MQTKTILMAILAVLAVALAGVLGYQKLTQPELRSALPETTPIVVKQPVINQPSDSCIVEGERGFEWYGPEENKKDDICCDGLTSISDIGKVCSEPSLPGGLGSSFICAYCGNGACGKGENKCNCPEDCKVGVESIFQSEDHSFKVNYPGSWYFRDYLEGTTISKTNARIYFCESPLPNDEFDISALSCIYIVIAPGRTLQNARNIIENPSSETEIVVDGVKAIKQVGAGLYNKDGIQEARILIPWQNKVYELSARGKYLTILEQMLSTFKFIK